MLIRSRVKSLTKHLSKFNGDEAVYVALVATDANLESLSGIGFSVPLVEGEQLLPPGTAGTASRRNADGDEIVHKDQPKETHHRQKQWTWEEFRGRYDKVERSKIVETLGER
jgi:DNA-binding IclR family transcriptional regulator